MIIEIVFKFSCQFSFCFIFCFIVSVSVSVSVFGAPMSIWQYEEACPHGWQQAPHSPPAWTPRRGARTASSALSGYWPLDLEDHLKDCWLPSALAEASLAALAGCWPTPSSSGPPGLVVSRRRGWAGAGGHREAWGGTQSHQEDSLCLQPITHPHTVQLLL